MPEYSLDEILDGLLLGDAYVEKGGRFGFNHSVKQKDYFNYKVSLLQQYGLKIGTWEYANLRSVIQGRKIKPTTLLIAKGTRTTKGKKLRERFYPNGVKIVPADLIVTPTTLAYWYMDDGTANLRSRYVSYANGIRYEYTGKPFIQQFRLYTDGFDPDSLQLLLQQLENLGIDAWLHTRQTGHSYIVISRLKSRERFKALVEPIVKLIPSMHYKVNNELQFQGDRLSEKAPEKDDAIVGSNGNTNH